MADGKSGIRSERYEAELLSYLDDLLSPPKKQPEPEQKPQPQLKSAQEPEPVPPAEPRKDPKEPVAEVPAQHEEGISLARQRLAAREAAQKTAALTALQEKPQVAVKSPPLSGVLFSPKPLPTTLPGEDLPKSGIPEKDSPVAQPAIPEPAAPMQAAPKPATPTQTARKPAATPAGGTSGVEVGRREEDTRRDVKKSTPPVETPVAKPPESSEGANDGQPPADHNGIPQWGEGRFECLLFSVAGLNLAVPLVLLGGVHPMKDDDLTPLFGMPAWFLGLFKHGEQTLKVVDSARWVMPEKYPADFRDHMRYLIRIHDSEWALACYSIADAFALEKNEVRWRTERSKRPWLAGTVVKKMCALLDVDRFREMLDEASPRKK